MGGSATGLLLSRINSGDTREDLINYLTRLPQGRVMKSSTIFLRDQNAKTSRAFYIKFDITPFQTFNNQLA